MGRRQQTHTRVLSKSSGRLQQLGRVEANVCEDEREDLNGWLLGRSWLYIDQEMDEG